MVELIPLFLWVFYFAPFMAAATRDHDATVPILVANALLGWTVVGWIALMIYALKSAPNRPRPRGPAVVIPFPGPAKSRPQSQKPADSGG